MEPTSKSAIDKRQLETISSDIKKSQAVFGVEAFYKAQPLK